MYTFWHLCYNNHQDIIQELLKNRFYVHEYTKKTSTSCHILGWCASLFFMTIMKHLRQTPFYRNKAYFDLQLWRWKVPEPHQVTASVTAESQGDREHHLA